LGDVGGVGGYDTYLRKYDTNGNELWTRSLATVNDESHSSVSTDSLGNVFVAGSTSGEMTDLSFGLDDIYLSMFNAEGFHQWTRQIGSFGQDSNYAVQADNFGNVYIAGGTVGDLGDTNAGAFDIYLAKFDNSGEMLWIQQFGSEVSDQVLSLAATSTGSLYLAGNTAGVLDGMDIELTDAVLVKYSEVPEPSTFALAAAALLATALARRQRCWPGPSK
jgi:hypothetical protein